jgi:hypothetical protein
MLTEGEALRRYVALMSLDIPLGDACHTLEMRSTIDARFGDDHEIEERSFAIASVNFGRLVAQATEARAACEGLPQTNLIGRIEVELRLLVSTLGGLSVAEAIAAKFGDAEGLKYIREQIEESRGIVGNNLNRARAEFEVWQRRVKSKCNRILKRSPERNACIWLGSGRLKIGDRVEILTADNDRRFIEKILDLEGTAHTRHLQDAGVSNPSETFKRLAEWKEGILAPFMSGPNGQKNAGYRTTIRDARKSIQE